MKFKIIGSGGCVSIPKPLCQCHVCCEARVKGPPYARRGCSIYLEDLSLLIDTPEDISCGLNYSNIKKINRVLFSHMDPDHVLGFRVFEQFRLNWFHVFEGKECDDPIDVHARPSVMADLNLIKSKYGSYLDYYENVRKLIKRKPLERLCMDKIQIDLIPIGHATIFVFREDHKKVIYAPCDVKPFPENALFKGADLLIIGNTFVGEALKDGYILPKDSPLRQELFSMEEIESLKEKWHIKKVLLTHLEEDWGKSYEDYLALEKMYEDITFAYDGMAIEM